MFLTDGWMDYDAVMEVIKENVGYDYLIQTNEFLDKQLKRKKITLDDYDRKYIDLKLADQMIRYMADSYCANKDLTISSVRVGSESVKARMMKIDADRFINAYSVLKEKLETVSNKKNYTLSVLFNG